MPVRKNLLWTLSVLLAAACAAPAQDAFALRHGDRVVLFGDSITDQRLYTEADVVRQQRAAAIPKRRHFELAPE